ncbi:hypothetical protein [Robertkochia sediminum]|uniref:hypothetical protein n=1 Tax=Robertkochia sediminum TaxID=2785326 RepID=UPI0019319316|nr:hypothetical protein [Robertkochia sediminum]MBL7473225.1 hypothetical protein [Robertkochia sediminum]
MFVRKLHSVIAIFLMGLLITAKLAAYHTLSHEDDCVECCSFCENVMVMANTPALTPDIADTDELFITPPSAEAYSLHYSTEFHPEAPVFYLFSRPPPAV